MQSTEITISFLHKKKTAREPLIALGSHEGGSLILIPASTVPHCRKPVQTEHKVYKQQSQFIHTQIPQNSLFDISLVHNSTQSHDTPASLTVQGQFSIPDHKIETHVKKEEEINVNEF